MLWWAWKLHVGWYKFAGPCLVTYDNKLWWVPVSPEHSDQEKSKGHLTDSHCVTSGWRASRLPLWLRVRNLPTPQPVKCQEAVWREMQMFLSPPNNSSPWLSARLFATLGLLRHESVKAWVRHNFFCHCFPLEIVRETQVSLNSSTCRKIAFLISVWRTEFPWWRGAACNFLMSWCSLARTAGRERRGDAYMSSCTLSHCSLGGLGWMYIPPGVSYGASNGTNPASPTISRRSTGPVVGT